MTDISKYSITFDPPGATATETRGHLLEVCVSAKAYLSYCLGRFPGAKLFSTTGPDPLELEDIRDDLFTHKYLLTAGATLEYFVQLPDHKIIQTIKIYDTDIVADLAKQLELAVEPEDLEPYYVPEERRDDEEYDHDESCDYCGKYYCTGDCSGELPCGCIDVCRCLARPDDD